MNSSQRMAAKRYALAYDEISQSVAQAQARAQELRTAQQILAGVSAQMQSPRIAPAYKKIIINETLHDWPQAAAFINVLIDAKRYNLLSEICKWVDQLLDDRRGISRAVVTSAFALSPAQQSAAQKALSARYGKTVEAIFKTDKSLLGGLHIVCNGEQIDGSVKHQLEKLKEEITK